MSQNRPRVIMDPEDDKQVSMGEHITMQDSVEFSDTGKEQVKPELYMQARKFLDDRLKDPSFLREMNDDDAKQVLRNDPRTGEPVVDWDEEGYSKLVDQVAVGMSNQTDVVLPKEFQGMSTLAPNLSTEIKDFGKEHGLKSPKIHTSLNSYLHDRFEQSSGGERARNLDEMIDQEPGQLSRMDRSYQNLTGKTMSEDLKIERNDELSEKLDTAMPPRDPEELEHIKSVEDAKQHAMEQEQRRLDHSKNEPEVPRVIVDPNEDKDVSMGEHVMMQDGVEFNSPNQGLVNPVQYMQARKFLESTMNSEEFLTKMSTEDVSQVYKQDSRNKNPYVEWNEDGYPKLIDSVAEGMCTKTDVVLPKEFGNMDSLPGALNEEIKDFSKKQGLTAPTVHKNLDGYLRNQFEQSSGGQRPRGVEQMIGESPDELPKMDQSYQNLTGRTMSDTLNRGGDNEIAQQLDDAMPNDGKKPNVAQKYLQGIKDKESENEQQIDEVKDKRRKEMRGMGLDD